MHLSAVIVMVLDQAEVCVIMQSMHHLVLPCALLCDSSCSVLQASVTGAVLLDRGHVGQVQRHWDHKEKGESAPVWRE